MRERWKIAGPSARRPPFESFELAIHGQWGVRWIRVSGGAQIMALCGLLCALGWAGYATWEMLGAAPGLRAKTQQIAALEQQLVERRAIADDLSGRLVAAARQRMETFDDRSIDLRDMMARSDERDRSELRDLITDTKLAQSRSENAKLTVDLAATRGRLEQANAEAERLSQDLVSALDGTAGAEKAKGTLKAALNAAERRAGGLKEQVVALQLLQNELVDRLAPVTTNQLAALEEALDRMGIDLDRVVDAQSSDIGGPLVDLDDLPPPVASPDGTDHTEKLHILVNGIVRLDSLRKALPELPLGAPLDGEPDLRSGFGTRQDPFTHRLAFHAGLDFAGPQGTEVKVTAPGEVVYAGWEGGYGRMVLVKHDFGIETRYAHLQSIAVAVGDKLQTGDVVGALGSSGRSTGPHLHYEVLFDDVPRDPSRFLEAGRHVQQKQ